MWCYKWRYSLTTPTTMPAKRLGMYHVHDPTLEMIIQTLDSGLGYKLVKETTENGCIVTPLSVLAYLSTLYPLIPLPPYHNFSLVYIPLVKNVCTFVANLVWLHPTCYLPLPLSVDRLIRLGLQSGSPHCLVDP
ncbi:unnamed protein product [Protopolystoma xenopodis]|uniref:Uncharacterized protein n=1 Tax=Protopolystoma xenopodis TaxID=117903 RepID=A0A3S5FG54_9PLAT|nr:unnamed protein product [Protopolystoma xenopodis]